MCVYVCMYVCVWVCVCMWSFFSQVGNVIPVPSAIWQMELPSDIPKTTINMQHVHTVKEKPQFYDMAFKMQDEWIKQLL